MKQDIRYAPSHEWIALSGNIGIVGISFFAQKELGEIVYIELPKIGKHLCQGEEAAVLESTKAAADIYTPVSGIIIEVNELLRSEPKHINTSPQKEGWLFKIQLTKFDDLHTLFTEEQYGQIIQG